MTSIITVEVVKKDQYKKDLKMVESRRVMKEQTKVHFELIRFGLWTPECFLTFDLTTFGLY